MPDTISPTTRAAVEAARKLADDLAILLRGLHVISDLRHVGPLPAFSRYAERERDIEAKQVEACGDE